MELKARELSISTSTITSYLNREVSLPFISRFGNIYNYTNTQLDTKVGGIYHQENINDYPRTNLDPLIIKKLKLNKRKRKEFNNQATIHYKHYECHHINIKLFTNGRLELTGIKTEQETELVSNLLIETLRSIQVPIYYGIQPEYFVDTNTHGIPISHHYFLIYKPDGTTDFIRYMESTGKYYTSSEIETLLRTKQTEITAMKKNISTTVDTINWETISPLEWNNSALHNQKLREFITPIIAHFNSTLPKINIEIPTFESTGNYLEFRSVFLEELNRQICNYMENIFHDYNKLANVFQEDISVLNIITSNSTVLSKLTTSNRIYKFPIDEVISIPGEYRVSDIETHLINSDYNVNFYINLDELVKVLTSYDIYNYYNPTSYPGILAKFYYNDANPIQGICNCERHCSTREKRSICTKITISIFRPGSIIITGSKSIPQLIETYKIFNRILFKHYAEIKGTMLEEDIKQNSILNNELRKLGRKHKIFYFPKSRIVIS